MTILPRCRMPYVFKPRCAPTIPCKMPRVVLLKGAGHSAYPHRQPAEILLSPIFQLLCCSCAKPVEGGCGYFHSFSRPSRVRGSHGSSFQNSCYNALLSANVHRIVAPWCLLQPSVSPNPLCGWPLGKPLPAPPESFLPKRTACQQTILPLKAS